MNSPADIAAIADLDLGRIKVKLCHASGEGWSQARADAAEVAYRRFLTLMRVFPAEQTVPTVDVDIFWHHHILDTVKYAADCDAVFGYFLHHDPQLGMHGPRDEAEWTARFARTAALHRAVFPVHAPAAGASAGASAAYCGVAAAAAYCGAAAPASAAYCGAAAPAGFHPGRAAIPYCGASLPLRAA